MSDETKKTDAAAPPAVSSAPAPNTAADPSPTLAKIPRAREQIQVDYTNTAAQLGNVVFQIAIMEQQRDALMGKLNDLGIEASKLPPEAPKGPPKLAAVPTPPKAGSDGT